MKCENCPFVYNEGGYETPCYMCNFFDCYVDGDICTLEGCKPKFTELLKLDRLRYKYDSGEDGKDYKEYRERLIKKYDK
jgi:hypothetical protein